MEEKVEDSEYENNNNCSKTNNETKEYKCASEFLNNNNKNCSIFEKNEFNLIYKNSNYLENKRKYMNDNNNRSLRSNNLNSEINDGVIMLKNNSKDMNVGNYRMNNKLFQTKEEHNTKTTNVNINSTDLYDNSTKVYSHSTNSAQLHDNSTKSHGNSTNLTNVDNSFIKSHGNKINRSRERVFNNNQQYSIGNNIYISEDTSPNNSKKIKIYDQLRVNHENEIIDRNYNIKDNNMRLYKNNQHIYDINTHNDSLNVYNEQYPINKNESNLTTPPSNSDTFVESMINGNKENNKRRKMTSKDPNIDNTQKISDNTIVFEDISEVDNPSIYTKSYLGMFSRDNYIYLTELKEDEESVEIKEVEEIETNEQNKDLNVESMENKFFKDILNMKSKECKYGFVPYVTDTLKYAQISRPIEPFYLEKRLMRDSLISIPIKYPKMIYEVPESLKDMDISLHDLKNNLYGILLYISKVLDISPPSYRHVPTLKKLINYFTLYGGFLNVPVDILNSNKKELNEIFQLYPVYGVIVEKLILKTNNSMEYYYKPLNKPSSMNVSDIYSCITNGTPMELFSFFEDISNDNLNENCLEEMIDFLLQICYTLKKRELIPWDLKHLYLGLMRNKEYAMAISKYSNEMLFKLQEIILLKIINFENKRNDGMKLIKNVELVIIESLLYKRAFLKRINLHLKQNDSLLAMVIASSKNLFDGEETIFRIFIKLSLKSPDIVLRALRNIRFTKCSIKKLYKKLEKHIKHKIVEYIYQMKNGKLLNDNKDLEIILNVFKFKKNIREMYPYVYVVLLNYKELLASKNVYFNMKNSTDIDILMKYIENDVNESLLYKDKNVLKEYKLVDLFQLNLFKG